MKVIALFLCLVCLMGCSSMQQINDGSVPQLLIQSPLPPIPEKIQHELY